MLLAALGLVFHEDRAWTQAHSGGRTGVVASLPDSLDSYKLSNVTKMLEEAPQKFEQALQDMEGFAETFYEYELGGSRFGNRLTAAAGLNGGVRVKPSDAQPIGYVGAFVQGRKNYYNKFGMRKQSTAIGAQASLFMDEDLDGKLRMKLTVSPHVAQIQTWEGDWKAWFRKHTR